MENSKKFLETHKIEYDLHTHSTISDGTFSPEEIISSAAKIGLKGISITDHDNFYEIDLTEFAKEKNIIYIKGVEFSTDITNLHILGYNINYNCKEFQDYISNQKLERELALKKMCEKSKEYNIPVDFEELKEFSNNKTLGRPHLAAIMVKKGYVKNIYHAFSKYLKYNKPIFVDYKKFNFKKIINIILNCNGIPVLAHPGMLKENIFKKIFMDAVKSGLKGIEAYYTRHSYNQTLYFLELAKKFNLIVTGGSDFHGDVKPDIKLGQAGINEEEFQRFSKLIFS